MSDAVCAFLTICCTFLVICAIIAYLHCFMLVKISSLRFSQSALLVCKNLKPSILNLSRRRSINRMDECQQEGLRKSCLLGMWTWLISLYLHNDLICLPMSNCVRLNDGNCVGFTGRNYTETEKSLNGDHYCCYDAKLYKVKNVTRGLEATEMNCTKHCFHNTNYTFFILWLLKLFLLSLLFIQQTKILYLRQKHNF